MPKRVKKPAVKPEVRRQWLKRFEEDGESPPQIAKVDNYDVRTVRKQIELARQEREAREARFAVLRSALEQHYHDLISYAQKLDSEVIHASLPVGAKSDRLWSALREHLPRSPLWKAIDRMERLSEEARAIEKRAEERLWDEVGRDSPVGLTAKEDGTGLHRDGLAGAMTYYLGAEESLRFSESHISTTQQGGLIQITCANWLCVLVSADQAPDTKKFIAQLMEAVGRWPEREDLRRTLAERSRVIDTIRDELATITLRRVLPERCRYCPI